MQARRQDTRDICLQRNWPLIAANVEKETTSNASGANTSFDTCSVTNRFRGGCGTVKDTESQARSTRTRSSRSTTPGDTYSRTDRRGSRLLMLLCLVDDVRLSRADRRRERIIAAEPRP